MDNSFWEAGLLDRNQLLISFVKKMPHLYNKTRPDYKDATKKNNSWDKIAKLLCETCKVKEDECTATEVKARWKSLREAFATEDKRINKYVVSGSGQQEECDEWLYYKDMGFMKPQLDHYRHESNYYIPGTDSTNIKRGNDFTYGENSKRPRTEELLDDINLTYELRQFMTSEANVEDSFIKENEAFLKSSGEKLVSLLQTTQQFEDKEMNEFQCLLVEKFSEIPEEKQLRVFNKLMDLMDKELQEDEIQS